MLPPSLEMNWLTDLGPNRRTKVSQDLDANPKSLVSDKSTFSSLRGDFSVAKAKTLKRKRGAIFERKKVACP